MATPDVRVKLSAEGVAEIVAAFETIRARARVASGQAASNFTSFNGVLGSTKQLLVGLGSALALGSIVSFAKHISDGAEQVQLFGRRLGNNVRDINALDQELKRMGGNLAQTGRQFTTFMDRTGSAARDGGKGARAMRDLGLSIQEVKDLANQDFAERFETIGRAILKLPEGQERVDRVLAALGPRAASLIPILEAVGEQGFGGLRRKAAELFGDFDEKAIATLGAVNDQFDDMSIITENIGKQMLLGFGPAFLTAMDAVKAATKDTTDVYREFGEIIGFPFKVIVGVVTDIAVIFVGLLKSIMASAEAIWQATSKLLQGDIRGMREAMESNMARAVGALTDASERGTNVWKVLFGKPKDIDPDAARKKLDTTLGEGEGRSLGAEEGAAALNEFDARVKKVRAIRDRLFAQAKADYASGLIDLTEYYSRRRKIIDGATASEISALQAKRRLQLDLEDQSGAEQTSGELARLSEDTAKQIVDDTEAERAAREQLALDLVAAENRIREAKGQTYAQSVANIEKESKAVRELLARLGTLAGTRASRDAFAADFEGTLKAQALFNERARDSEATFRSFSEERDRIDQRRADGLLTQSQATEQLLQLERDRLPILRKMADLLFAAAEATGNRDAIAKAKAFNDSLEGLDRNLQTSGGTALNLAVVFENSLTPAIADGLSTAGREVQTFGGILSNTASSVVASVQRMIAQFLALKAVSGILSLFGGGGGGGPDTGPIALPGLPTEPVRFATGGLTPAIGTATSDSIIARLSAHEYVQPARRVREPGALHFLETMRRSGFAAALGHYRSIPRYAEGGLVEASRIAATGGGVARADIGIGLEDGLIGKQLDSPRNATAMIRFMRRNAGAINSALGG